MFTDLAFIDWVALVFAALLLAAASAAAVVAYVATKNRPKAAVHASEFRPGVATFRKPPAHAVLPTQQVADYSTVPMMAAVPMAPPPAPPAAPTAVVSQPEPPILISSPTVSNAVMSDGVRIESSSSVATPEDTVAARAAKLRGRPVPEPSRPRKRIVSGVEPSRMPANGPSQGFVGEFERSGVSIDMDRSAGFSTRAPGFFDDPVGRHDLRYWDGHRWTEYVKEHGERFIDPL